VLYGFPAVTVPVTGTKAAQVKIMKIAIIGGRKSVPLDR
jgi:hypothetical protein